MLEKESRDLIKFRADPVIRRALKLRAALDDVDLQDVVVKALQIFLAEEIAEVERRGLVSGEKPAEEPPKPGRKKKDGTAE